MYAQIPTPMQMRTPDILHQAITNYGGLQAGIGQQIKNRLATPLAQARIGLLGAQTGLTQAKVPLTQAQTGKVLEATQLLPQTTNIAQANALAKIAAIRNSADRFSNTAAKFAKVWHTLSANTKAQLQANNPDLYAHVQDLIMQDTLQSAAGVGGQPGPTGTGTGSVGIPLNMAMSLVGVHPQETPTPAATQQLPSSVDASAAAQMAPGASTAQAAAQPLPSFLNRSVASQVMPTGSSAQALPSTAIGQLLSTATGAQTPVQTATPAAQGAISQPSVAATTPTPTQATGTSRWGPMRVLNPNTAQQLQSAAEDDLVKNRYTTAIRNQMVYSTTAGALYNHASQFIPSLTAYTGYTGSMNSLMQRLKSGTGGQAQKSYSDLLKLKQVMPMLSGELRKQLQTPATDSEQKIFEAATSPDLFNENPAQVIAVWNNLGAIINKVGAALSQTPGEIFKNLGHETTPIPTTATGQAAVGQDTFHPRTHFTSNEDFVTYMTPLSPAHREQVKHALGLK